MYAACYSMTCPLVGNTFAKLARLDLLRRNQLDRSNRHGGREVHLLDRLGCRAARRHGFRSDGRGCCRAEEKTAKRFENGLVGLGNASRR
jgi:hypothetical protein